MQQKSSKLVRIILITITGLLIATNACIFILLYTTTNRETVAPTLNFSQIFSP